MRCKYSARLVGSIALLPLTNKNFREASDEPQQCKDIGFLRGSASAAVRECHEWVAAVSVRLRVAGPPVQKCRREVEPLRRNSVPRVGSGVVDGSTCKPTPLREPRLVGEVLPPSAIHSEGNNRIHVPSFLPFHSLDLDVDICGSLPGGLTTTVGSVECKDGQSRVHP